jgi:CRP-like cAMP-binding protein
LSEHVWQQLEAGASIQIGDVDDCQLIGLADGVIAMTTILGYPDTPIIHLAHPELWLGYGPSVFGEPRRVSATARSPVWVARMRHAALSRLLDERPEWWRHFTQPTVTYGDIAVNIAADLLIRNIERRCAANLCRNSVVTMLRRLQRRGMIEPAYRGIRAPSPTALREFVEHG